MIKLEAVQRYRLCNMISRNVCNFLISSLCRGIEEEEEGMLMRSMQRYSAAIVSVEYAGWAWWCVSLTSLVHVWDTISSTADFQ